MPWGMTGTCASTGPIRWFPVFSIGSGSVPDLLQAISLPLWLPLGGAERKRLDAFRIRVMRDAEVEWRIVLEGVLDRLGHADGDCRDNQRRARRIGEAVRLQRWHAGDEQRRRDDYQRVGDDEVFDF